MAAHRVDVLTDSNALLCGILTDKDIATRVITPEVNIQETPVSKIMTKNPVFVLSDTLAVEALQKMVLGKFRHLPVVENGEVIALLDVAKCLYDAIARPERAAEKGKAIAAAVEGVEKHWGTSGSASSNTFIETLREQLFRPSLSTIISESTKIVTVGPNDTVLTTTKKMLECHASSAIETVDNKPRGILISKDLLMRVIAQDLSPEATVVDRVMTPNPERASLDMPIVDALHTMHDGKFLHLCVVDKGTIHLQIHFEFWDSAISLTPDDDDDVRSDTSLKLASEGGTETGRSIPYPSSCQPNSFSFKIKDKKGRMYRFNCDIRNMTDLIAAIIQRVGGDIDRNNLPQILYEDEDHDKVVLASDSDLSVAADHARSSGWKGLKLHLGYSGATGSNLDYAHTESAWASAYSTVASGTALVAGLGVSAFLRRSG
ncbi:unnamed protein product [Withania somnifera]